MKHDLIDSSIEPPKFRSKYHGQKHMNLTKVIRKFMLFDATAQCYGSKVAFARFLPFFDPFSFRMPFPSARKCLEEFDLDKDGKLSHAELGSCLFEVLSRGGCPSPKRTSALMLEEWALRSEGLAAGRVPWTVCCARPRATAQRRNPHGNGHIRKLRSEFSWRIWTSIRFWLDNYCITFIWITWFLLQLCFLRSAMDFSLPLWPHRRKSWKLHMVQVLVSPCWRGGQKMGWKHLGTRWCPPSYKLVIYNPVNYRYITYEP